MVLKSKTTYMLSTKLNFKYKDTDKLKINGWKRYTM